jgi:glycosidase
MTPGVGTEGRDAERTPMQWDGSATAGFTAEGVTPWLPYGDNARRNVADQRDDPDSTLNLCRNLLALRKAEFGGQVGSYAQLPAPPGVWAYRSGPLQVAANFTGREVTLPALGEVLLTTGPLPGQLGSGTALGPWQGLISRAAARQT